MDMNQPGFDGFTQVPVTAVSRGMEVALGHGRTMMVTEDPRMLRAAVTPRMVLTGNERIAGQAVRREMEKQYSRSFLMRGSVWARTVSPLG